MVLQISALLEETAAWAVVALLTLAVAAVVMMGRRGANPGRPTDKLHASSRDAA